MSTQEESPDLSTDIHHNGQEVVVELRGRAKRKVHKPDPDAATEGRPFPACAGESGGFDKEGTFREFKFRTVEMAENWREGCNVCYGGRDG